jgi:acetylglutamate kinase
VGVLRDVEDENSLIELITAESFASLREAGVVSKGMIPKIDNALRAIEAGVNSVIIQHSDNILSGKGTTIR